MRDVRLLQFTKNLKNMENIIAYVTGLFNRDQELGKNQQNVRTIVSEELCSMNECVTDYIVRTISSAVCGNLGIA